MNRHTYAFSSERSWVPRGETCMLAIQSLFNTPTSRHGIRCESNPKPRAILFRNLLSVEQKGLIGTARMGVRLLLQIISTSGIPSPPIQQRVLCVSL